MNTNYLFSIWHTVHIKGNICLLTVATLFGISLNAFADGTININSPSAGSGYTWDSDLLTINSNGTYTFNGEAATLTLNFRIATYPNLTDVNITLNNVNIKSTSCAFSIGSGTTVKLTLEGTNTLESGGDYAGLQVPSGATLIIVGDDTLNATGGNGGGAGIGGAFNNSSGIVIVNGGTVMAKSVSGAGIGNGDYYYANDGTVIINGGIVVAQSSGSSAGIGGGSGGCGGTIIIKGGMVMATSAQGAGIGNGRGGTGNSSDYSSIIINGGMVVAESNGSSAGIGRGSGNSTGSEITINGGTVVASSTYGAYIKGTKVFIDGGSVKVSGSAPDQQPTNTDNTPVYLNTLILDQPSAQNTLVTGGKIDGIPCNITPNAAQGMYGIKDVLTNDEGKLYFWLPATGTSQIVSITADTTYDNRFIRNANDSNIDTLYKAPAVITGVMSSNGGGDTSGMVFITFSRPMPTGNTEDTVMLICRECIVSEIVLPISNGTWENGGRRYKIPFKELEYSSTYRVYATGFRDTTGRAVEKDTTHTFSTKLMQTITPAEYISTEPYIINNPITAEKGEYKENNGGSEGDHIYQWYRFDENDNIVSPIPGATNTSYTPTTDDFGKYIYIETTPVGSEGHQVRPVPSERIRVGVKLTAGVSGAHGGTAVFANGRSDTVVYNTDPVKLSLCKNFPDDRLVKWSDNPEEGVFIFLSDDTTYSPPPTPEGDVTLTAILALGAPQIIFPVAADIIYGDMLSKATLTGESCSGMGSFAWEARDTVLKAGEHYLFVAFTPTDHMVDYDYRDLEGWDNSSRTVRRLVSVMVVQKNIYIIGGKTEQKIYDGTTTATVDSLIFSGLVEGDTLRPGRDYGVVSNTGFDTPTAGNNNKTVTLTATLASSELASNYNLVNGINYPLEGQSIDRANVTTDLLSYAPETTVVYDGQQQHVSVDKETNVEGLGAITVLYDGDPTPPTNAGTYTVTARIEEGDNYKDTVLELGTLIVSKAPITDDLLDFNLEPVTYDGMEHSVTVNPSFSCGEPCAVTITYNGSENKPVDAGEYEVVITIKDVDNYRDTALTLGTFTINTAGPTADLLGYNPEDWVATYNRNPQDVSVNKKDGIEGLGAITVLYDGDPTPPTNAGAYSVTVHIEEGGNYKDTVLTLGTLTINKAQLTEDDLKFGPIQDTYDGTEHGVTVTPRFPCAEPCTDIGVVAVTYNGNTDKPVNEGEYIVAVMLTEGDNFAEVTEPLVLGIFRIKQPTILSDTVCLNEAYTKNGFSLPMQTQSGLHRYVNIIGKELYDSVTVLNLRVYEPILFSVENPSICADDTVVEVKYELEPNSRIPSYYSIAFDNVRNFFADDIENAPLPAAGIFMPRNNLQAHPDVYNATFRLSDDRCHSEAQPLSITVSYPSSIMEQKWSNVIALLNQRYNWGGYDFIAYRWFKDGEEIPGATRSYLYTPSALDSGSYSVLLTGSDGVTMHTCPLTLAPVPSLQNSYVDISAYPTILNTSSSITIISVWQGEAVTRNIGGAEVSRQKFGDGASNIVAPEQIGIYFVELSVNGKKAKTVKILVK